MQTLKELIEKLPPELQEEVQDFVEFLLERRARRPKRKPKFDWAGALRDLRDRYSSVLNFDTLSPKMVILTFETCIK